MTIKIHRLILLIISIFTLLAFDANGQNRGNVVLSVVSVENLEVVLPKKESRPTNNSQTGPEKEFGKTLLLADDDVVLNGVSADRIVRFRLKNTSENPIFYLVDYDTNELIGTILSRTSETEDWVTMNMRRGKTEGVGSASDWRELLPNASIEFDFADLSTRTGCHALSILINDKPEHTDRNLIISEVYSLVDK